MARCPSLAETSWAPWFGHISQVAALNWNTSYRLVKPKCGLTPAWGMSRVHGPLLLTMLEPGKAEWIPFRAVAIHLAAPPEVPPVSRLPGRERHGCLDTHPSDRADWITDGPTNRGHLDPGLSNSELGLLSICRWLLAEGLLTALAL